MALNLSETPWALPEVTSVSESVMRGAQAVQSVRNARLLDLQRRALDLRNRMEELKITEAERALRIRERGVEESKEIANLIETSVRDGRAVDPEVQMEISSRLFRNPAIAEVPSVRSALEFFQKSAQLGMMAKHQQDLLKSKEDEINARYGNSQDLDAKAKALGLEPSGLDEFGRSIYSRPRQESDPQSRTGVLPEIERIFEQAEKDGTPFTPESKEMARKIRLGLEGREGVEKKAISEAEYVAKNLAAFMKTQPTKMIEVKWGADKKVPLTEDEAITKLQEQYQNIFGQPSTPKPPATGMIRVRSKKNPQRTGWATQADIDTDSDLELLPPGNG